LGYINICMNKVFPTEILSEISSYMTKNNKIDNEIEKAALKDFTFYEFDLKDLNLPSAEELLLSVLEIKKQVGTRCWTTKDKQSRDYYGFSLTHNPQYRGDVNSIYHQSWGSSSIINSYSREIGSDPHSEKKNTYYDTYGFRVVPPIVKELFDEFLAKISFPILRSRVAFYNPIFRDPKSQGTTHIDESPTDLLRINIPLQTSAEHLLDISGSDEYGNSLTMLNKHLEVGKAYLWNTRIPHRIHVSSIPRIHRPRIHIVLGMAPWFDYNQENDYFCLGPHFRKSIKEIVEQKLFLQSI